MNNIDLMSKDQFKISKRNNRIAWLKLKACGAIPNDGKKYCLHHWDESLRHDNIDRYIQWNLYDLEVMGNGEHCKIHNKGEHNHFFGKHHSEESRKKISEAGKGRHYKLSEETRRKMSNAKKGKSLSDIHKKHLSEAGVRYWLKTRSPKTGIK